MGTKNIMKTAVINVTGHIQKVGYRTKIVAFAEYLGIKGYIKNLPDKSVEIAAQGNEDTLKIFIDGTKIQDKLIQVDNVEVKYFDPPQDYTDFDKIVGPNETDARLDDGITLLKKIANILEKNHVELVDKMDHNHAELTREIRDVNQGIVNEINGLREDNSERIMNELKETLTNEIHKIEEGIRNEIVQKIETLFKDSIKQS
jgi:acylphosphatase